jgi:ribonuclease-3
MRTKLVNGQKLAEFAKIVGLDRYVIISKQIEDTGGRFHKNVMEDALEAFIGVIFLETGFEHAKTWIVNMIETHTDFAMLVLENKNYKDTLIKYYQHNFNSSPVFQEISMEYVDNKKVFTISVKDVIHNTVIGIGKGCNKKDSEQNASMAALRYLGK